MNFSKLICVLSYLLPVRFFSRSKLLLPFLLHLRPVRLPPEVLATPEVPLGHVLNLQI